MPALWQSSQKPMYVRTVWVDGFRHAILTQDDPYLVKKKRRRPNSSASTNKSNSRLSYHEEDKLNLIVKSGRSIISKRPKSCIDPEIEKLNLTDIEPDSDEDFIRVSPQTLNESGRHDWYMRNFRMNKTARTEENTELSDRVLQWLDLAGKVELLAANAERMAQPRHSWPELQRRHLVKSKTVIDIRKIAPKACDSPKAQPNACIDRHDFYVPTSANTIENYAKQSRNKNTPRQELKTKETKTKQNTKVVETRQKVATERTAVQKQYNELVSKKLIPDVSKNSKKQVHIFMPEMPKKPTSISATTSREESLLSHQALKLLRQ